MVYYRLKWFHLRLSNLLSFLPNLFEKKGTTVFQNIWLINFLNVQIIKTCSSGISK